MATFQRYLFTITVTLITLATLSPGFAQATVYRLGVPEEHNSPTYQKLFNSIRDKGLTRGHTLEIVPIALPANLQENEKEQLRQSIAQQCDLFFSTGDSVTTLFNLQIKTPLLFISTISPSTEIPASMKETTTGFYWGPTATIFKKSLRFLPQNSKQIAIIYFRGSKLSTRTQTYEKIANDLDISLTIKSYADENDIARVMTELKAQGIDGIFLFPPAIRNSDLAELVKWQINLKLPIIGQSEEHIRKGLLGGPAVDSDLINPRLTDYAIKIFNGRTPGQLPPIYLSRPFMLNLSTVSKIGAEIAQDVIDQSKILGTGNIQERDEQTNVPLVPGHFTIGVPDTIGQIALQNLLNSLQHLGYKKDGNLTIVSYDLVNPTLDKQELADKISDECNLFFTTGNALPSLLQMPEIEHRTFANTSEIGIKMQELQAVTDFILLYPPSVTDEDITEIVVWQNKLKFPVLAQTREQIQAGLVGGPTVDYDKASPKLASYVDKLLHGRKPSSLPIYHISENIIVNLRAVTTLGLDLPEELISQAEIIR
nr:hypothetical protein [Desulfobulbaceae bacterium]